MNISSRRSRDKPFVTAKRAVSPLSRLGFSLCALALSALAPQAASAQGRLDAQYEATLAGIPVGKGAWTIEIGDDTFAASAQGGTAGLLKAFSGGTGSGASQGRVVGGALVANAYTATTTTQKKSETIRLLLANGNVKDFSIDPVPPVDPDRIVVTDAHRKGVLDPMTGSMLRVAGNGEVLRRTYGGFAGSETELISRGVIFAGALDGPKARVLLTLLLAAGIDRERIAKAFAEIGSVS